MTPHPTSDDMLNAQMALVRDRMAEVDVLMGWGLAAEAPPPPWASRGKRSERPTHLHEWVAVAHELDDAHAKVVGVINEWSSLLMMRKILEDPTNTDRTMRLAKAMRDVRQESKANPPAPTLADRFVDAMENALAELDELADGPSVTVTGSMSEEEVGPIPERGERESAAAEQAIRDVGLADRITPSESQLLSNLYYHASLATMDAYAPCERISVAANARAPDPHGLSDSVVAAIHLEKWRGVEQDIQIAHANVHAAVRAWETILDMCNHLDKKYGLPTGESNDC